MSISSPLPQIPQQQITRKNLLSISLKYFRGWQTGPLQKFLHQCAQVLGKKNLAQANEELSEMVGAWCEVCVFVSVCVCVHTHTCKQQVRQGVGGAEGRLQRTSRHWGGGWALILCNFERLWSQGLRSKVLCSAVARGNYKPLRGLPRCRYSQF